jgi:hypothetical protein
VQQDSTLDIVLGYTDTDGPGPYTFTIVQGPASGVLSSDDGDALVTYTPDGGYTGSDSFTFLVNDGMDDSNEATVNIDVSLQSTLLQETFDGDSTTVGNGWVELEGSGTEVGLAGDRLVFINTADVSYRPMVTHTFQRATAGQLVWDFDFDWQRSGPEGTYRLFMQLGDGAQMDAGDWDNGIGVNLMWAPLGNHEQLGYRAGGVASALTQVSGAAAIRVVVDLNASTYDVMVDGVTVGADLPMDNVAAVDTVRFFTDALNENNFSGRAFDNVRVTGY